VPIVPMSDPPTTPTTLTPGLDAQAGDIVPPPADGADLAATTQMPMAPPADPGLDATSAAAGAVPPPIDPPDAPVDPDDVGDEATPWYKKPGPLAALIVVLLAIAGLIGWLVFGGSSSDDTATPTASRLVLETTDQTGAAIQRGFLVSVVGPATAPTSYTWLRPADAVAGEAAGASSNSNGRAMFDWEVDDTVSDPTTWAATVTVVEGLEAGRIPPGPVVDCVLTRPDAQDSTVSMNVAVDSPDVAIQRTATYTFPNYQFLPGDSVTCKLVSTSPGTATTVVESTAVATTEAATTVPETTIPETTLPPTTIPASTTTTSIDIPPPAPGQTVWDLIDAAPSLSEFKQFVIDAGFQPALENPDATFTIFAPTNEAIAAARASLEAGTVPVSPEDLSNLLLAHANNTGITQLADLLKLPNIAVMFGGPQKITATPPTVGGANIYVQVPPASNGVLYLIDQVLTPQP
jgi:uncharacterized surface protein with fasciclin (FAS1) repeats